MIVVRMLARWLIGVIAVAVTVWIVHSVGVALRAPEVLDLRWPAIVNIIVFVPLLALVNAIVGTVLRIVTLPLSCLTLGLIGLAINAVCFWIAGAATGAHMTILAALVSPMLITLIATPLSWPLQEKD